MRRIGHKPHSTTAGQQLPKRHADPGSRNSPRTPASAIQHRSADWAVIVSSWL